MILFSKGQNINGNSKKVTKLPNHKQIPFTTKKLQINTFLYIATKFISGNTPQIAPLCQHLDHIKKCGREARTSFFIYLLKNLLASDDYCNTL